MPAIFKDVVSKYKAKIDRTARKNRKKSIFIVEDFNTSFSGIDRTNGKKFSKVI